MNALSPYLPINPFVDLSVGEAELWGSRPWLDVPQIHATQAAQLRMAVDLVRANHRTQVRFVRGVGGSGKSHLFARLRRDLTDGILYAYAPNPPLLPEMLESFVLAKIVASLRHRARTQDGSEAPYSQLRLLAYALLRPVVEQTDLLIEHFHDAWCNISPDARTDLLNNALVALEAQHPMVSRAILRALLQVLRDDRENLAGQWLAGSGYLTEADLAQLGAAEPLGPELRGAAIHLLGRLAAQAGRPFVLVLDQLDLVTSQAQLDEFQRLLFGLIDESENWVVFIGLVGDRFRFWEEHLNQALCGRIGLPSLQQPGRVTLPVIDVSPIVSADKEVLLRQRMLSPALLRQRAADGISAALHPLLPEDVRRLTDGGAVYARHLLAAASEAYTQRVLGPEAAEAVPLPDKVDALLDEAADAARAEAGTLSALELGERVRELVLLLQEPTPDVQQGPLRESAQGFDGTDHVFQCGARRVRIVTTDATRRPFISVLEQLQHESGNTLLLRSSAAAISGQVTVEMFRAFKTRNHFFHVPASEAAVLVALGHVLAALREGNYDHLVTEPAANEENFMAALRECGRLRGLRVWQAVQTALAARPRSAPAPLSRTDAPAGGTITLAPARSSTARITLPAPRKITAAVPLAPAAKLSQHALEAVQVLLRMERWMEMSRLQRRLAGLGCEYSLESLRHALRSSPLSEHAILHPAAIDEQGDGLQIVLWQEHAQPAS